MRTQQEAGKTFQGEQRRMSSPFAFPTVDAFVEGQEEKYRSQYRESSTYWRNGFPNLNKTERQIAELVGATREHVLLTTAGMSALVLATELTAPTKGDAIVYPSDSYKTSQVYYRALLPQREVYTIPANPGSTEDIEEKLKRAYEAAQNKGGKVKAIVMETLVNSPKMPVLDLEKFFRLPILQELKNTTIILDNSLATNSILPLASILRDYPDLKVIIVESATKSYLLNRDNGGIIVTSNSELAHALNMYRKTYGVVPGPSLIKTMEGVILPSPEQFDWENRTIARNTLTVAKACSKAQGAGITFDVNHPGLNHHPQHDLARKISPDGAIVPVGYIVPRAEGLTAEHIAKIMEQKGLIGLSGNGERRDVEISESWGFKTTSISLTLPDTSTSNYVRFAGGLEETEKAQEVAYRFQDALSSL